MNIQEAMQALRDELLRLGDAVQRLEATVAATTKPSVLPSIVAPVTVPTKPPKEYQFDDHKLLMNARQVGSARVDPVVDKDCPNTVFMPVTGHVLSVPRPDLGEMFMGYCMRVSDQAQGNIGTVGALGNGGTSGVFAGIGGYKEDGSNWALGADKFYNMKAYMSPEQKAQDELAQAGWAKLDEAYARRAQERAAAVTPAPVPAEPVDIKIEEQ